MLLATYALKLTVESLVPISVNNDAYLAIIDEIRGIKGLLEVTKRSYTSTHTNSIYDQILCNGRYLDIYWIYESIYGEGGFNMQFRIAYKIG